MKGPERSAMKPTNPALWDRVKKKYRATSAGTRPGRWSARKAALSRLEYKRRGGDWKKTPVPSPAKFREGKK